MEPPILIDLPDSLITERTLVRPWRSGDGVEMFEAVDESRQHILPWLPWGPGHVKTDDSETLVRTFAARWLLREDLAVAIRDRATDRLLGGGGLHRINWNFRTFEIGYWIRKSATGRGHVTDAARLLTDLAFGPLQARRVFIRCAAGNERSIAVAQRAGFQYEGRQRNAIITSDDQVRDILSFSMIPEEWNALRKSKLDE